MLLCPLQQRLLWFGVDIQLLTLEPAHSNLTNYLCCEINSEINDPNWEVNPVSTSHPYCLKYPVIIALFL